MLNMHKASLGIAILELCETRHGSYWGDRFSFVK